VYYVSSVSGLDTNTGLDPQNPWRTLSKVQSAKNIIRAGDSVLFKRGETFVGTFRWDRWYGGGAPTGTASAPITFASYGTSTAKPIFQYPALTASSPAPAYRVLLSFFGVDYLVIDGLNFTDTAFPRNDKLTPANMGIAIQLGVGGEALNMHNTVRNVDMSNIGMGVTISGDFNVVDRCTMTDLKNLVDTACANPNDTGFCSYDDYGANGVTVTGNDNVISNNLFTGNWAHSTDFGYNGGAVEAYGAAHGLNRNKILYNTIFDCGGVMEIGSTGVASSADNVVAYNLLVNDGMLTWVNLAGPFATTTSNVQYYNNTIVQTPTTRFSEGYMFGAGGTITATTLFRIKNNIFYLSNGDDVLRSNVNIAKYDMGNNVYQLGAGSVLNYTAATGDVTVPIATAIFTNTTSSDPTAWDYRLLPNSAARRNGANLNQGFTRDLPGVPITTPPDCGAYQGP
jgi:hypothetical protein